MKSVKNIIAYNTIGVTAKKMVSGPFTRYSSDAWMLYFYQRDNTPGEDILRKLRDDLITDFYLINGADNACKYQR